MTEDKIFLIGNYIVELRENKKLKKYEFAEILGISPSAVSQWEKGGYIMFNRLWLESGKGEMFITIHQPSMNVFNKGCLNRICFEPVCSGIT